MGIEEKVKEAKCLRETGHYTRYDVGGKGGLTVCTNKFEKNTSCDYCNKIGDKNYCTEKQEYQNE